MIGQRPPYVTFAYRSVEDRPASIAAGSHKTKDVPFIFVTRPGTKDTHEENAETYIKKLHERAKQEQIPATWPAHFEAKYKAWLQGEELPVSGTALKTWPPLLPSQVKSLLDAGFRTVEDLAAAADNEISAIGTGAISLKQKAQAWLDQASGNGKVVERLSALEVQLADLLRVNKDLQAENIRLKMQSQTAVAA